jgi:hypothetical protein
VAADLHLGQPHRAQLTVTVGGEAARRETFAGDLEVLTMQGGPRGIGDGDAGAISSPPMCAPIIRIAPSMVDARTVHPSKDTLPSVRSSSAYSAGFDGMGQKAPSQRQARQVSGLGGETFIQQTLRLIHATR